MSFVNASAPCVVSEDRVSVGEPGNRGEFETRKRGTSATPMLIKPSSLFLNVPTSSQAHPNLAKERPRFSISDSNVSYRFLLLPSLSSARRLPFLLIGPSTRRQRSSLSEHALISSFPRSQDTSFAPGKSSEPRQQVAYRLSCFSSDDEELSLPLW